MEENYSNIFRSAMRYGLILGLYWIIKYIFYMFALHYNLSFSIVYLCLTLYVPFLAYSLTVRYRRVYLFDNMSFAHAWRFGVLLYFFAALLVSLLHFLFYKYYFADDLYRLYVQMKPSFDALGLDYDTVMVNMGEIVKSPINMTFNDILGNVFYGVIFSLPTAAFAKKNFF